MLGKQNMSSLISINKDIINKPDLDTFIDREENKRRMMGYSFPIFAGRIINFLLNCKKERNSKSILITGRSGIGKTNLGLFLENFLYFPSRYPMIGFLANNAGDFPLKKIKDEIGRYFIINIKSNDKDDKSDLSERLSQAVKEAVENSRITGFTEYEGKSAVDTLKHLIGFLALNRDWDGLAIFMDNQDRLISDIQDEKVTPYIEDIKKILEFINSVEKLQTFFIAIGSVFPDKYITKSLEKQSMNNLNEIFGEVFRLNYEREEWIDFVTKKVLVHSSINELEALTQNAEFQSLAKFTVDSGLFQDKGSEYVLQKILPYSFPLHPLTLIFLPMLSEEISRKEKNLLAFFSDTAPGSFRYYLDTFGITQATGKLSIYTPDFLFSYYEQTIKESPNLRNIYEAVEKAYTDSGNLAIARRIIRLIALMQIVNDKTIKSSKNIVFEALHLTRKDMEKFEPVMGEMIEKDSLKYDQKFDEILLPVQKSSVKIEDFVYKKVGKIKKLKRARDILNESYRLKAIPSIDYNNKHKLNRKAMRAYYDLKDIRQDDFLLKLYSRLGWSRTHYKGDVAIIYVITENEQEMIEANNILTGGDWVNASKVIAAMPVRPCSFLKMLFEKRAMDELKNELPFSVPDSDEKEMLDDILNEAEFELKKRVDFLQNSEMLHWYYKGGNIKQMQERTIQDLVNALMEENFHKTPVVENQNLTAMSEKKKNREIRKRAVRKILFSTDKMRFPRVFVEPADILINDVLIKNRILEKTGEIDNIVLYSISGTVEEATPLSEVWNKLYSRMIESSESERQVMLLGEILQDFKMPPYGINPSVLEVLLAAMLRDFTKTIEIFRNFREMQMTGRRSSLKRIELGYNEIMEMVRDPEDIIIRFIKFTEEEKALVQKTCQLFGGQTLEIGDTLPWNEAKKAIFEWFDKLPEMVKVPDNFKDSNINAFIRLLEKGRDTEPRIFFEESIPTAFDYNPEDIASHKVADKILEIFQKIHTYITKYSQFRETALWRALVAIFSRNEEEFDSRLKAWVASVKNYSSIQDISGDAKILVEIDPDRSVRHQFFVEIPRKMSIDAFSEWKVDKTLEYIARISRAKMEIAVKDLLKAFSLPIEKENRQKTARETVEQLFNIFNISDKEKKTYILSLYKNKIWEKTEITPADEAGKQEKPAALPVSEAGKPETLPVESEPVKVESVPVILEETAEEEQDITMLPEIIDGEEPLSIDDKSLLRAETMEIPLMEIKRSEEETPDEIPEPLPQVEEEAPPLAREEETTDEIPESLPQIEEEAPPLAREEETTDEIPEPLPQVEEEAPPLAREEETPDEIPEPLPQVEEEAPPLAREEETTDEIPEPLPQVEEEAPPLAQEEETPEVPLLEGLRPDGDNVIDNNDKVVFDIKDKNEKVSGPVAHSKPKRKKDDISDLFDSVILEVQEGVEKTPEVPETAPVAEEPSEKTSGEIPPAVEEDTPSSEIEETVETAPVAEEPSEKTSGEMPPGVEEDTPSEIEETVETAPVAEEPSEKTSGEIPPAVEEDTSSSEIEDMVEPALPSVDASEDEIVVPPVPDIETEGLFEIIIEDTVEPDIDEGPDFHGTGKNDPEEEISGQKEKKDAPAESAASDVESPEEEQDEESEDEEDFHIDIPEVPDFPDMIG